MVAALKPKHLIEGDCVAFDTETTGLNAWKGDSPFAFSFYNEAGESKYYEWPVDPFTRKVSVNISELEKIKRLLEDKNIRKVMHNAKFDVRMMDVNFRIKTAGPLDDTMIMAFCCNTMERNYKLKQLADKYAGINNDDEKQLKSLVNRLRRHAKKLEWNIAFSENKQADGTIKRKAIPEQDYWLPQAMLKHKKSAISLEEADYCQRYAVEDVERTLLLWGMYRDLLKELGTEYIYRDIEMSLWPIIYAMETKGPATSLPALEAMRGESMRVWHETLDRLKKIMGEKFEPTKDKQVRVLLYDKLNITPTKFTKGGLPVVNKYVFREHLNVPAVRDLVTWKAHNNAVGTFFNKFEQLSVKDSHGHTSIHCQFKQTGAKTGRMSCADPNLQNVMDPGHSQALVALPVRPVFVSRPDYSWLCVDYEGMEMRMFGLLSEELEMMKALRENRKIHNEMTERVWGGKDNEGGLLQTVRVLGLDGTGCRSPLILPLWKDWGLSEKTIATLSQKRQFDLANEWLALFDYSIIRSQSSVGLDVSKTNMKNMSFLKIYRGGPKKAASTLNCSVREARETLDLYDRIFPRIEEYCRELIARGRKDGYITSLWQRRVEIDPQKTYRAVNYMIQGSCADLLKQAMIWTSRYLKQMAVDGYLLMAIHDELVFEIHKAEITRPLVRNLCRIMADTDGRLELPMNVEPKLAPRNWGEKIAMDIKLKFAA